MSHCSALEREVKSELVDTVKVSVNATHGSIVVANFQLASNTGTFQLDVQVLQAAAVPISQGCTAVAHFQAQVLISDKSEIVSCLASTAVFTAF